MPALVIFRSFTTRPFGGDDLHIVCIVLGLYRLIQFICLVPLCIHYYLLRVRAEDVYINGIPPWCRHYQHNIPLLLFLDDLRLGHGPDSNSGAGEVTSIEQSSFHIVFVVLATIYLAADVTWGCMVWSAASLGTPTESEQRDKYLRKLIIFKMFISNIYPLLLLVFGVRKVHLLRMNNYGCGAEEPKHKPDEGLWYNFFCALLITYAIELLVWPAVIANHTIRKLRSKSFLVRSRVEATDRRAERFERFVGMLLSLLQCVARIDADFRNDGELKEFAVHFMDLMNYNTKLDIVLSDMYVGLHMLARVQAEEKAAAIHRISQGSKLLHRLVSKERKKLENCAIAESDVTQDNGTSCAQQYDDSNDPFLHETPSRGVSRRNSLFVLTGDDSGAFEARERDILGSGAGDQSLMRSAVNFAKYAQIIYGRLKRLVEEDFNDDPNATQFNGWEATHFKRPAEDMFRLDFRLGSIGCEHAILCYASFANSMVTTPYAILVDEEVKNIVIAVRGTLSLDDLVADLQYNPASLEKTGNVCGFQGNGRYCHKGFLTRAKWLYNDINKSHVLRTLYSDRSPFKEYPLILCGHSLGAGCASILSIMLRPAFPSLRCFAYCPPGPVVDDGMAKICEEFITCLVRQDDLIPRLSHHNFETLRHRFLRLIARVKVPKIKLFFDIRKPCPDNAVVDRNAKVLRAIEDVSRDTEFYKRLETFRTERATILSVTKDESKLFIPGKIVHLVDTKGDNSDYKAYVPCWASRHHDFNQVIISKRMKSDHSMMELVDILRDVPLNDDVGNSVTSAFFSSINIAEPEEDEEPEIRLFMCFSNPDGKIPIALSLVAFISLVLSGRSMTMCNFFSRESAIIYEGTKVLDIPFSIGLFSYTLLTCADGKCDSSDKIIPSKYCVPYPDGDDNGYMQASRVFAFLVILCGGLSFLLLCVSTCLSLRKWAWIMITCILLFTSMFQGLVLLLDQSNLCVTVDDEGYSVKSKCHLSIGSIEAILAGFLYFMAAVGSMYFARMKGK